VRSMGRRGGRIGRSGGLRFGQWGVMMGVPDPLKEATIKYKYWTALARKPGIGATRMAGAESLAMRYLKMINRLLPPEMKYLPDMSYDNVLVHSCKACGVVGHLSKEGIMEAFKLKDAGPQERIYRKGVIEKVQTVITEFMTNRDYKECLKLLRMLKQWVETGRE